MLNSTKKKKTDSGVTYDRWSTLPPEILEIISRKLDCFDYIRFRAVCPDWRKSTPKIPLHIDSKLPCLMLPQSRFHSDSRKFLTLPQNSVHDINLPEACYPRRQCGSSHGWLTIVEESPRIFLINPLTRAIINLPPLSTFPNVVRFDFSNLGNEYLLQPVQNEYEYYTASLREMRDTFIKKTILSNSPSEGSYFVAVAIIRRDDERLQLAYYKSGQNSWGLIEDTVDYAEDVTFFNDGLIYSLDREGCMCAIDVRGDSVRIDVIGTPYLNKSVGGNRIYLVHAMGELLLVARYIDFEFIEEDQWRGKTNGFKVFRYDFDGIDWEELTTLGSNLLFLGENSSLCFSLSNYPEFKGGNKIYFSNDFTKGKHIEDLDEDDDEFNLEEFHGDHDVGIFDLEDGTVVALTTQSLHVPLPLWPPPVWVSPCHSH